MGLLARLDCDVTPFWEFVEYNPFGVQFRYETIDETEEALVRSAAISAIDRLLTRVREILAQAIPET